MITNLKELEKRQKELKKKKREKRNSNCSKEKIRLEEVKK